jgi:hypothetical protein
MNAVKNIFKEEEKELQRTVESLVKLKTGTSKVVDDLVSTRVEGNNTKNRKTCSLTKVITVLIV